MIYSFNKILQIRSMNMLKLLVVKPKPPYTLKQPIVHEKDKSLFICGMHVPLGVYGMALLHLELKFNRFLRKFGDQIGGFKSAVTHVWKLTVMQN